MSYEFQSCLYNTRKAMCMAISGEWLSAGGANDRETIVEALSEQTDAEMARECVEAWGLDQEVDDDSSRTWMQARDIDIDDIIAAFEDIRANPAEAFCWEDGD